MHWNSYVVVINAVYRINFLWKTVPPVSENSVKTNECIMPKRMGNILSFRINNPTETRRCKTIDVDYVYR